MKSYDLLQHLRSQTMDGYQVTVAESLKNDTIRLTYRTRPDGRIVGWQVEGPGLDFPLSFKDEQKARDYIRCRWSINPHVKQYGEP